MTHTSTGLMVPVGGGGTHLCFVTSIKGLGRKNNHNLELQRTEFYVPVACVHIQFIFENSKYSVGREINFITCFYR